MYIKQLNFTRFVAAVLIVFFHFGRNIFPFNFEKISFLASGAAVWVSYFFTLSGFVMIVAYYRDKAGDLSTQKYWRNRFARIYPVYFFALLLTISFLLLTKKQIIPSEVFLNFALLQSWFPAFPLTINLTGWSLSVEIFFYFLFPFLFNYWYKNRHLGRLLFGGIIFWILTQVIFNWAFRSDLYAEGNKIHDLIFYFPLFHLNEFILGNIGGLFFLKYWKSKKYQSDWPVLILLAGLFLLLKFPFLNYHDGFLVLIFIPLIILLAINNGFIEKFFSKKIFITLGEISYGVYILQIPVFCYCEWFLKKVGLVDFLTLRFYFSLLALFGFSFLVYKYFEMPMRNYFKKLPCQ